MQVLRADRHAPVIVVRGTGEIVATLVALSVGIAIGAIAGYYGGWVDNLLMRLTELFQTIPAFIFAIVLVVGIVAAVYLF